MTLHDGMEYSVAEYFVVSEGDEYLRPVYAETHAATGRWRTIAFAFWNNFVGAYYTAIVPAFFAKAIASERGTKSTEDLFTRIESVLGELVQADYVRVSADHLIRQSVVATWTSLECLASDLFVALVNGDAKLAERMLTNEGTRKFYQHNHKSLFEWLQESGFDLSSQMGSFLARQRPVDDVETMRAVFGALFPENDTLMALLSDKQLWHLHKSRNLIVHRGAEVDETFLKNTGIDVPIGRVLKITPEQYAAYMALVGRIGGELLKASKVLQPSD